MNGVQPIFLSLLSSPAYAVAFFCGLAAIYFLMFRNRVVSILDPLAYSLVFSSFACSSVLLVSWEGYIQPYYLMQFLLTQTAFVYAMWYASPAIRTEKYTCNARMLCADPPSLATRVFFSLCLVVNIGAQLSQYYMFGLPILLDSRLIIDAGEGGTNVLSRLIVPTAYIVQILSLIMILRCRGRWKALGFVGACFIGLTLLLNGSKSGVISFALILSLVAYYFKANSAGRGYGFERSIYLLGGVGILFTLGIIRFKYADTFEGALSYLLYRFLITGDGFIMGYVGGVIEKFQDYNWFIALFKGPIRMTSLVDSKEIPPPIGFELYQYHNPWSDLLVGPNSRHNLIGIRYMGFWGSILLSFVLGFLVGVIRMPLRFVRGMTPFWFALTALGVYISPGIETDFYLFWGKLMNIIFILPPIYFVAWVLSHQSRRNA